MFDAEPPSFCLTCLHKRRLVFRNGTKLYRRKCDYSGDEIISLYAPDKPYTVYKADVWWSDKWDPLSFGRAIDFNRPFFDQFYELQLAVPRLALINVDSENSPYCNMCQGNKNCYLVCGGDFNEDCLYNVYGMHNRSVLDSYSSNDNEECYFLIDSFHCYGSQFVLDSKNCSNCAFVSDCAGCQECILCTNLVQKRYCIENEQLSLEEYKSKKSALLNGTYSQQQDNWNRLMKLRSERIVKEGHMLNSEACTGDYSMNSKGCENCFEVWDCEDMVDVILASKSKDVFCSSCVGDGSERCFQIQSCIGLYDCHSSYSIFDSRNVEYSDFINSSHDVFGCIGLTRKQYCILNMQYSKEEFFDLRSRIVAHMKSTGEWKQFLPPRCSCFGYNESTAMDYFPLTKEQAEQEGFLWFDEPDEALTTQKAIPSDRLPDDIADVPNDILSWVLICEKSHKPYKITKQELAFYRTYGLAVPRLHPDERRAVRVAQRNPCMLYERTCVQCNKDIQTTYSPDRLEIVYCEECYLKEVY